MTEKSAAQAFLVPAALVLPVDCSEPSIASSFAASMLAHNVVIRPLHSLVRISIGRRDENDALVVAVARVIETKGAP